MKRNLKLLLFNLLLIFILSNCRSEIVLTEPVILISELEDFQPDGNFDEWKERKKTPLFCNQTGEIPDKQDLNAFCKLAYNKEGLGLYFHIEDDINYTDTIYPWNGDAVGVFIAPSKGSEEILQISISLLFDENGIPVIRLDDQRKETSFKPQIRIKGSQKNGITEMEAQIDLDWILPGELDEKTFALQVYIDDSDRKRETEKNRLTWFNNNYSSETSLTYFPVKLCQNKEFFPESTSRVKVIDDEKLILKTFGMSQGDTLKIFRSSLNGISKLIEKIIIDDDSESFDLSELVLDFENDEIYVFQDTQCIAYHDLILAPREYINIVPPKFYDEIRRFRASDKAKFPVPNSSLFIGSSSIKRWLTLESDFPELNIIHRGFGGSNSADVLRYITDIVLPYKASKIIYYEGDNDIPEGIEIDSIAKNIKTFIEIVKQEKIETEIYIISPKPAIVRLKHYDKYKELHIKLKEISDMTEKVIFVDVASPMFLADGSLDESLFVKDRLHMNEKGYKIWTNVLRDIMGLDE